MNEELNNMKKNKTKSRRHKMRTHAESTEDLSRGDLLAAAPEPNYDDSGYHKNRSYFDDLGLEDLFDTDSGPEYGAGYLNGTPVYALAYDDVVLDQDSPPAAENEQQNDVVQEDIAQEFCGFNRSSLAPDTEPQYGSDDMKESSIAELSEEYHDILLNQEGLLATDTEKQYSNYSEDFVQGVDEEYPYPELIAAGHNHHYGKGSNDDPIAVDTNYRPLTENDLAEDFGEKEFSNGDSMPTNDEFQEDRAAYDKNDFLTNDADHLYPERAINEIETSQGGPIPSETVHQYLSVKNDFAEDFGESYISHNGPMATDEDLQHDLTAYEMNNLLENEHFYPEGKIDEKDPCQDGQDDITVNPDRQNGFSFDEGLMDVNANFAAFRINDVAYHDEDHNRDGSIGESDTFGTHLQYLNAKDLAERRDISHDFPMATGASLQCDHENEPESGIAHDVPMAIGAGLLYDHENDPESGISHNVSMAKGPGLQYDHKNFPESDISHDVPMATGAGLQNNHENDPESDISYDVPIAAGVTLQNDHESGPCHDFHITSTVETAGENGFAAHQGNRFSKANPMARIQNIQNPKDKKKGNRTPLTPAEVEEKISCMESVIVKKFTHMVKMIMLKMGMKEFTRDLVEMVVQTQMKHRSQLKALDSGLSHQDEKRLVPQIPPKPKMYRCWLVYNGQQQYPKGVPPPTDPMYGMVTTPNYALLELHCQAAEPEMVTEVECILSALVCANSLRRQAASNHLSNRELTEVTLISLSQYILQGVEEALLKEKVEVLKHLLNAIDCLVVNDLVDLPAYLVDTLLEAVNKCLLTTKLGSMAASEDPWMLRQQAAKIVFKICRKYNNGQHLISEKEIRLMNSVVFEGHSIAAMYGAIATYAAFGAQVVLAFMKPQINRIYWHIGKARTEYPKGHPEYLATRRLLDMIITVPVE